MEKLAIAIIIAFIIIVGLSIFILTNNMSDRKVYKLGEITICDPYHDKTACSAGG